MVVAFWVYWTIGIVLHGYVFEVYMDSHDAAKLVEIRHAGVRRATVKKIGMDICVHFELDPDALVIISRSFPGRGLRTECSNTILLQTYTQGKGMES